MKTCSKCGQLLPFNMFYKDKNGKDGFRASRKKCKNESTYRWRDKNREAHNAKRREYFSRNRESINLQAKKYYSNNKDAVKRKSKRYRENNKEKVAALLKRWNKEHPEYDSNRRHKRRAQLQGNGVFQVLDKEVKRLYSSNCIHCGTTKNITMDHLIPVSRGGRHSIGNIVPMCQKCNFSKHAKLYAEWRYENVRASKS